MKEIKAPKGFFSTGTKTGITIWKDTEMEGVKLGIFSVKPCKFICGRKCADVNIDTGVINTTSFEWSIEEFEDIYSQIKKWGKENGFKKIIRN
jgi:hypothetical protein